MKSGHDIEGFYRSHYKKLLKRAERLCNGNHEEAEDLIQETFLKIWKMDLSKVRNLEAWFQRVMVNLRNKLLRKERSMVQIDKCVGELPSVDPDYVTELLGAELFALIRKEKLPKSHVLSLHYEFGLSAVEIAMCYDTLTYNQIRSIISNFKRKVVKKYERDGV